MTTLAELSKAVRPYDPEDKRQRNSAFLPGLAAGGAVATGFQTARQFERSPGGVRANLRDLRSPWRLRDRKGGTVSDLRTRFDVPGGPGKSATEARMGYGVETQESARRRAQQIKRHGASAVKEKSGGYRPYTRTYTLRDLKPEKVKQLNRARQAAAHGTAVRGARARAGKWGAATVGLSGLAALGYSRAASKKNRRWE